MQDDQRPLLTLLGGGVRSGKSRYALTLAEELGSRRVFIATAEPLDDEMRRRIDRHREERAEGFITIEEPLALPERLRSLWRLPGTEQTSAPNTFAPDVTPDVIVVDCLTLWISNLLVRDQTEEQVSLQMDRLLNALRERRSHVILVSNEVGMGLVPETPLGRIFRDVMGALHQRLAAEADHLVVGTMGALLRIHPGPIALIRARAIASGEGAV